MLPLAALAIGFGYGFVTPVSSHILARRTPPGIMALVFSVKQTGVPIGGAIAGAAVPPLVLALGWADSLPVLAAACIVTAFALLPARATLAEPRAAGTRLAFGLRGVFAGLGRPIQLVLADRRLRELASPHSATPWCNRLHHLLRVVPKPGAGLQPGHRRARLRERDASGIAGRIAWGAVADRWVPPRAMLAVLGAVSAACGLLTAAFWARGRSPRSSPWRCSTPHRRSAGTASVSGGGRALRAAGQVGTATGGTQFFTFGGAVAGPPVFAAAVSATGSYAWAFALFAIPPLLVAARLAGPARANR